MKSLKYITLLVGLFCLHTLYGQQKKVIDFVGGARSIMSNNNINVKDSLVDSTTVKRNTGGYALIDLGVNIRPNKQTEILGMFRIQNGYGGFWGSGVTFDVRQLWVKGIVANVLRYQLGDLNLKQSPYTLYNHQADRLAILPDIFNLQQQIINYEKFYTKNNTWRQQGANIDFGLSFKKYAKELNVNAYTTRLRATDFSSVPDRLMSGITTELVQSKNLKLAYHLFNVNDVKGTVLDSNLYTNTVHNGTIDAYKAIKNIPIQWHTDFGTSKAVQSQKIDASLLTDYFINTYLSIKLARQKSTLSIGYLNVGPQFRSIGAQSKDINYNALPNYYNKYTNAQIQRPLLLMDVISNANIYNTSVSNNIMPKSEVYNNALPYGEATFNRVGFYAKANYTDTNKGIQLNASQYNLSEIKGQGTLYLSKFNVTNCQAEIAINKLAKFNKVCKVQLGLQLQNTRRNSNEAIENIKLSTTVYQLGMQLEVFNKIDVLAGYVALNTLGNEFATERNEFTNPIFFTKEDINVKQNIAGLGLRCKFTDKIYLAGLFQNSQYTNGLNTKPNFNIQQFSIIYNMLF
jgi:hypothetical protein